MQKTIQQKSLSTPPVSNVSSPTSSSDQKMQSSRAVLSVLATQALIIGDLDFLSGIQEKIKQAKTVA